MQTVDKKKDQGRRITVRLTPFQARRLGELREMLGERTTATEAITRAILALATEQELRMQLSTTSTEVPVARATVAPRYERDTLVPTGDED